MLDDVALNWMNVAVVSVVLLALVLGILLLLARTAPNEEALSSLKKSGPRLPGFAGDDESDDDLPAGGR